MTAAKNVYALMLALVIVLSGCFGNTADDTDAQTPDVSGPDMIAIGGHYNAPGDDGAVRYIVATINTNAGEMIQVHEVTVHDSFSEDGGYESVHILTNCSGGVEYEQSVHFDSHHNLFEQHLPSYLPGAFSDCTHEIIIRESIWGNVAFSWSLVYSTTHVDVETVGTPVGIPFD